ncbi:MAG: DUF2062 domain-containing protein [Azoarcus sp.]|nr:DUF2062 domain-containing protein [Azoarcus sp.]
MRSFFRRRLPRRETIARHRWLRPFAGNLLHPFLWYLNRQSVARGVAIGLFCGLIPGPFQMLGAALVCVMLRANLPVALVTTLYTNPFTIVPLYFAAFMLGHWALGDPGHMGAGFVKPPELGELGIYDGCVALMEWMSALGKPLALGLLLLASALACAGYFAVYGLWRLERGWRWQRRSSQRKTGSD